MTRDRPENREEIKITPQMIEMGAAAFREWGCTFEVRDAGQNGRGTAKHHRPPCKAAAAPNGPG